MSLQFSCYNITFVFLCENNVAKYFTDGIWLNCSSKDGTGSQASWCLWFMIWSLYFCFWVSLINDIFAIFISFLWWKYFISCFVSCKNSFNLDKRLVRRLIWTCKLFDQVLVYLSCLLYEGTWCISECEDLFWYLTIKCLCHYNINVQRDSAIFLKRIGDVL